MESSLSNRKKAASVTLIQSGNERLTVAAPFQMGVRNRERVEMMEEKCFSKSEN